MLDFEELNEQARKLQIQGDAFALEALLRSVADGHEENRAFARMGVEAMSPGEPDLEECIRTMIRPAHITNALAVGHVRTDKMLGELRKMHRVCTRHEHGLADLRRCKALLESVEAKSWRSSA